MPGYDLHGPKIAVDDTTTHLLVSSLVGVVEKNVAPTLGPNTPRCGNVVHRRLREFSAHGKHIHACGIRNGFVSFDGHDSDSNGSQLHGTYYRELARSPWLCARNVVRLELLSPTTTQLASLCKMACTVMCQTISEYLSSYSVFRHHV